MDKKVSKKLMNKFGSKGKSTYLCTRFERDTEV
jgi:hypothetical protein